MTEQERNEQLLAITRQQLETIEFIDRRMAAIKLLLIDIKEMEAKKEALLNG